MSVCSSWDAYEHPEFRDLQEKFYTKDKELGSICDACEEIKPLRKKSEEYEKQYDTEFPGERILLDDLNNPSSRELLSKYIDATREAGELCEDCQESRELKEILSSLHEEIWNKFNVNVGAVECPR